MPDNDHKDEFLDPFLLQPRPWKGILNFKTHSLNFLSCFTTQKKTTGQLRLLALRFSTHF